MSTIANRASRQSDYSRDYTQRCRAASLVISLMHGCGCNGIARAKARHLLCVARAIGDQQIPKMVMFALPACVAFHSEPTLVRSASGRLRGRLIDSRGLGFRRMISHAVTVL